MKINTNASGASSLVYSTYLGGSGDESGNAIAVDQTGMVYVAGATSGIFPTTSRAVQAFKSGFFDVFVTTFSPAGQIVYSTYLGGSSYDVALALAVDRTENIYVTGQTQSTNFPTTAGGFQTTNHAAPLGWTSFVTKLNPTSAGPSGLLYSTYLGGSTADTATAVALDSLSHIFVSGYTKSPDFPVANAIQPVIGGDADGFVAEIDPSMPGSSALVFSTFIGGFADDESYGIALVSDHRLVIAGFTDGGFPTSGAYPYAAGGSRDAFVVSITSDVDPPVITAPVSVVVNAVGPAGATASFDVSATDEDPAVTVSCLYASGAMFPIGTTVNTCSALDPSGNRADASFPIKVKSAVEQISDLEEYVAGLGLANGLANGLEAKLQSASTGPLKNSCSALNDFIAQVNARTGKAISVDQSAYLVDSASRIQAVLGCR
jgi:hypothetical protein